SQSRAVVADLMYGISGTELPDIFGDLRRLGKLCERENICYVLQETALLVHRPIPRRELNFLLIISFKLQSACHVTTISSIVQQCERKARFAKPFWAKLALLT